MPKPKKKPSKVPPANWREMEVLSVDEVAAILRCSGANVTKLLHERKIEAVKVGGRVLVRSASVAQLLDTAVSWHDSPHSRGSVPHAQKAKAA